VRLPTFDGPCSLRPTLIYGGCPQIDSRVFTKFSHSTVKNYFLSPRTYFLTIHIGIVSRDFVVCFLVSFDKSHISTHQEWVLLLWKVRFRIEFFDFCVWAWWAPEGKWRLNLSKYGAHTQEFFYIVYVDYYCDPVKKNGAKFWTCKKSWG
jgi:hypothetical protein